MLRIFQGRRTNSRCSLYVSLGRRRAISLKKADIITSICLLIFSGVLYFQSGTFPIREGRAKVLNAGFYPQLLAVILGILALFLLVVSLRKTSEDQKGNKFWTTKSALFLFFLTLGMLIIYPFLLSNLGFIVATFIFIVVLAYCLSDKEKFSLTSILLVSTGITAIIFLVFKIFIKIPFPTGYLF